MTTATSETVRFATARPAWTRLLPPLGGIGLVAGLFVSFNSPLVEDSGDTPAEVVAKVSDHKHVDGCRPRLRPRLGGARRRVRRRSAHAAPRGDHGARVLARAHRRDRLRGVLPARLGLLPGAARRHAGRPCTGARRGRGLPDLRRRRLGDARRGRCRRRADGGSRVARRDPQRRAQVARLARGPRRDPLSGDVLGDRDDRLERCGSSSPRSCFSSHERPDAASGQGVAQEAEEVAGRHGGDLLVRPSPRSARRSTRAG